ncbi:MAG: hypothetical protein IT429_08640 [Gemmataceae bacterium]|nr:hypothetical protein [Gemmataceae bacterium]
MKSNHHNRFTAESLRGASADFTHPSYPEPEATGQGGLPFDANDLGGHNWESFWIDLGGEG